MSTSRAIAAAALICFAQGARAEAPAMTATLVEGDVTVIPAAGGPGATLSQGAALEKGATLVTGPAGRVEVTLSSGTVIRLGHETRFTLTDPQPAHFSARLAIGELWTKVHKLLSGETFHVETENGVAGVRGTEFRIETGAGKQDLLRVYEGAVEVKHGDWTRRVEPGHELRFTREAKPGQPARFDPASDGGSPFMKWVRAHPTKAGWQPGRIHRLEQRRQKSGEQREQERERRRERRLR